MKIFIFISCFILPFVINAQIINIESIRLLDTNSYVIKPSTSLFYNEDISDKIEFKFDLPFSLKFNRHKMLGLTSYHLFQVDDVKSIDNILVHLRYNYEINHILIGELFAQTRSDDFLGIYIRQLLGGGLRYKILFNDKTKLFFGTFVMYEYEKMDDGTLHYSNRMSDYISLVIGKSKQLSSVIYYQPKLNDFSMFRFAWSSKLNLKISKKFSAFIVFDMSYDSHRPEGIRKLVKTIRNGIQITIKK